MALTLLSEQVLKPRLVFGGSERKDGFRRRFERPRTHLQEGVGRPILCAALARLWPFVMSGPQAASDDSARAVIEAILFCCPLEKSQECFASARPQAWLDVRFWPKADMRPALDKHP